jgi:hypothetical protein
MHEAAQARKEVSPPTTRAFDNLKTDADHKHERLQACRRHLHGGDIGIPRTSSSSSRHRIAQVPELAGGRERSLALVAKVAVTMQSVLQTILPMCILYFARIIDRCARSKSMHLLLCTAEETQQ